MKYLVITLMAILACNVCLADDLGDLMKEMAEQSEHQTELKPMLESKFKDVLPVGKQSYGEFEWSCRAGRFISVKAKDSEGKQHILAQVFYHLDLTDSEKKYFNKTCLGYPAKRFEDKWVWILVGRTEIRFFLSDQSLESDEILDAIAGSFDLERIKQL